MISPKEARQLTIIAKTPTPGTGWGVPQWMDDIWETIRLAATSGEYSMCWADPALTHHQYHKLAQLVGDQGYDVTVVAGPYQHLRVSWERVNDQT